MDDEPLLLWSGRSHSSRSRPDTKFLNSVVAVTAVMPRTGLGKRSGRQFEGVRIGRGNVAALMLGRSGVSFRTRRAYVGMRIVRLDRAKALKAAFEHLRYLQRDGVERDGQPGRLYSATDDNADGKPLLQRSAGDRHQFRLVASPQDSHEYENLKPLVRRFMDRMEEDLETRLDWVAADHFDTRDPHTHIILRGVDDHGGDLIIAPAYMCCGARERLAGLVSIDLGPKMEFDIEGRLSPELDSETLTSIDRRLLREMDGERRILPFGRDMLDHSNLTGRLQKLSKLGLAETIAHGWWRLSEDVEPVLCRLGERAEILRTMQQALAESGIERCAADQIIHRPYDGAPIIGRLIAGGIDDQVLGRHFLLIDGIDGRSHFVDCGQSAGDDWWPQGSIIRITGRTVEEPELKLLDEGRGLGSTTEVSDGSVKIELISAVPLERQPDYNGATWLDRQLADGIELPRDAGFGRELRSVLALRRAWLIDQGLAWNEGTDFCVRRDLLDQLERREITRIAEDIAVETGLAFASLGRGSHVEGMVRRQFDLASGRFAMIENSHEFTLVPWQPQFARAIGRPLSGLVRNDGSISWSIDRGLER